MASLTHVCVWSKSGWKRITPEEVAYEHPEGSISGHSGLFMCDLCKQPVSYVHRRDGSNYFDHFKTESKSCPDHSDGKYISTYKAEEYNLPIRIVNVSDYGFEFEMGLLPISKEELRGYRGKTLSIASSELEEPIIYSFERLNADVVTYVPIGDYLCKEYKIDSYISGLWPHRVVGMQGEGVLFNVATGQMLTDDADVLIGKNYYLLTYKSIDNGYADVTIRCVLKKTIQMRIWYIYKVVAANPTRVAANFFLKYGYRLTDEPVSMQPIWPVYSQSPYIIRNTGEITWFHVHGKGRLATKAYPSATMLQYPADEGNVYSVEVNERQELVSIGRTKALEYMYIWKDSLTQKLKLPEIQVFDVEGKSLLQGKQETIPPKCTMCISAMYDGSIQIRRNGVIVERIKLVAGKHFEYNDIQYGMKINILRGLDIIWSVEYCRKGDCKADSDDLQIVHELMNAHGAKVPVSHTLGATLPLLKNYPVTKKWISKKIRSGYIEESAFVYYKHFIGLLKKEGKGKR